MNVDELPLSRLRVLRVRDESVLLDTDLAALCGVETKTFNQAIKRDAQRFPRDFAFQLSEEEWAALRSQFVILAPAGRGRHRKYLPGKRAGNRSQNATSSQKHRDPRFMPFAFTEHGAIQAANVLNSDAAVQMGVHVVRAFVRLRQWLGTQKAFAAKLDELESRVGQHDEQFAAVIEALRQLTASPEPSHDRKMGFHRGNR